MQGPKILSLVGLVMVVGVLAASHALPRLPEPVTHRVPVDSFPRQVGEWKADEDAPVDPEVQKVIPTAKIVTRTYHGPVGETVELTLLSAERVQDFHNPNECFPGQGWQLSERREAPLGGRTFNVMGAEKDGVRHDVYYCWIGSGDLHQSSGVTAALSAVRNKVFGRLMDRHDGMSLFVRVISSQDPRSRQDAQAFIGQLMIPVDAMLRQSGA